MNLIVIKEIFEQLADEYLDTSDLLIAEINYCDEAEKIAKANAEKYVDKLRGMLEEEIGKANLN